MNWHTRLTQARIAKNLKKIEFSRLVGVSAPTVTDWENGDTKKIEGDNLLKVCSALDISPNWLINGIDDQAQPFTLMNRLDERELKLMALYRSVSTEGQDKILRALENLLIDEKSVGL